MSIHDVYIYCAESDVAPFVNIIGTADKDNSEDVRYLIEQIVELAEIASVKYLDRIKDTGWILCLFQCLFF